MRAVFGKLCLGTVLSLMGVMGSPVQAQDVPPPPAANASPASASLGLLPPVMGPLIRDQDFRVLANPVRTSVPDGDVEVIGFFHYGSPWVQQVAPFVQAWMNQAGPRVHFTWAPAVLDQDWGWGARVYFALQQTGDLDSVQQDLLVADGTTQLPDRDPQALMTWLHDRRVDEKAFAKAMNDGKVIARASWVPSLMARYEIRTVPTFVINGKYLVESNEDAAPLTALARTRYIVENILREPKTAGN